jgi:tyrosinase
MADAVIRRDVRSLSAAQLGNLRDAFRSLQQDAGAEGFQALAALHVTSCQHEFPMFLAWHREFLIRLEMSLRRLRPDVTDLHLPFWDWTDDATSKEGIPEAYRVRQYQREVPQPDGSVIPEMADNPLHHGLLPDSQPTKRGGRPPYSLIALRSQLSAALHPDVTSFEQFTKLILMPHNSVHAWIGGTMQALKAAYDPIFWAHHAAVDRYWAYWQTQNCDVTLSAEELAMPLSGFPGRTVADVMDLAVLGYDYDYDSLSAPASFAMYSDDEPDGGGVKLHAHNLRMDCGTYLIHVFVNQPDASHQTPLAHNPHYAGSFGIFGCGSTEDPGHPMPIGHDHQNHHPLPKPHAHPEHHQPQAEESIKMGDQILNLSKTAARVAANGEPIQITLVAETADGVPVMLTEVPMGEVSVKTS